MIPQAPAPCRAAAAWYGGTLAPPVTFPPGAALGAYVGILGPRFGPRFGAVDSGTISIPGNTRLFIYLIVDWHSHFFSSNQQVTHIILFLIKKLCQNCLLASKM